MEQQKLATESAYWPLYHYDPRLKAQGKNPFQLDSRPPKISFKDYALHENRYRMLQQINPEAEQMFQAAQEAVLARWKIYEEMAQSHTPEAAAQTPAKATEEV
jgi:pyruvate-ferredoxin/flavodoxin oxidoreductase